MSVVGRSGGTSRFAGGEDLLDELLRIVWPSDHLTPPPRQIPNPQIPDGASSTEFPAGSRT